MKVLKNLKIMEGTVPKLDNIAEETADILAQNKIIGWYQGRMEFGPRALGSRSILASPITPEMQARLNEVKDREDFRPVAPVVLEEEAANWFENAGYSPFMLFIYDVNLIRLIKYRLYGIPTERHVYKPLMSISIKIITIC
jgi:carbamoyltransferase